MRPSTRWRNASTISRRSTGRRQCSFAKVPAETWAGPISFLCYSFGSPNWVQLGLSGHSCYTPRLGAMMATHGDYAVLDAGQFLPDGMADPEYRVPEVIIVWAQNPAAGCQDGFYGHWVVDCMKRGLQAHRRRPSLDLVLAPGRRSSCSFAPAPMRALALGMLNVIISEGLYDEEFVEEWTSGFEELRSAGGRIPARAGLGHHLGACRGHRRRRPPVRDEPSRPPSSGGCRSTWPPKAPRWLRPSPISGASPATWTCPGVTSSPSRPST